MAYSIHLQPDAIHDLDEMRKYDATKVLDGIEDHLASEPMKESRSRIKKLRGKQVTDYRLRIDNWRIFYRVRENTVQVLRIMDKSDTADFYSEEE